MTSSTLTATVAGAVTWMLPRRTLPNSTPLMTSPLATVTVVVPLPGAVCRQPAYCCSPTV